MTNNLSNNDLSFHNITKDTDCDCLKVGLQNTDKEYVRKVYHPSLKSRDFKNRWDKLGEHEKEQERKKGCKNVCGLKGVSCNEWNELTKNTIISKYKERGNFSPKSKEGIIVFKIKASAGYIKHTPTQKDSSHHDFYRCDNFDINNDFEQLLYQSLNDL